ncbi:hypothetical protein [Cellulomonas phragmiteti]|uniref:DUF91 domain-containing protein n=1 Tax=Cellulomonas phragmiteti TaxID=478780 RepID=A0ABQ4DPD1_9CELL|nr:hypothetical protein [Cellulomonas phragmiteti]GIG41207.1 hypothetical protein Cph01nite_29690 [Cellulomonas phragmiteti]
MADLMHWAGQQPHLDPAHRSSFRAWQYRGQRVLGIKRTVGGLTITAGIDGKEGAYPRTVTLRISAPLAEAQLDEVQAGVESGCRERDTNPALSPDEHWLQAVLRRDPGLLGLEQPVLREVAAWRPCGSAKANGSGWGRGFVDLAGLDAAGNLLLVETKLDGDDMLVLQGLDYWIWANANRDVLAQRLDCSPSVPIEIVFCVGGKTGGEPLSSRHMEAQLAALPPGLTWRVVHVTDWVAGNPPAITTVAVSGNGAAGTSPSVDHRDLDDDRREAAVMTRAARLGDIAEAHYAWSREVEAQSSPDVRTEGISDAGEHYADVVATPEQNAAFLERVARTSGTDPFPTER